MRESYQNIRLSLYISWEPGSQVPSEFAALLWHLESVLDVTRNVRLKFHQNRVSNSWDIARAANSLGTWEPGSHEMYKLKRIFW